MASSDNGKLALIVIDGSNVAMNYGQEHTFACRGLRFAVNYFKRRGHEVTVYVPEWRRKGHRKGKPIKDQHILEQLLEEGVLVLTPSECYDDRYILDCASKYRVVVVSNDRFQDLANENDDWKNVISNRVLQFSFVGEQLTLREFPLGRNGPTLSQFLRVTTRQPERSRNHVLQNCQPAVANPTLPPSDNGCVRPPRMNRLTAQKKENVRIE